MSKIRQPDTTKIESFQGESFLEFILIHKSS